MVGFSYSSFSSDALEIVKRTPVFAYADNVPATPEHLRSALEASPPSSQWERWKAAAGGTKSRFTPELKAVLVRANDIADKDPVDPKHLAAALDS